MPIRPEISQCTHIKLNGYRCGSPALTGQSWCYFHARLRRGAKARLDAAIPSLLLLEDAESIQGALMQIIDMLLLDQIDLSKARLIIHAIEVASRNVKNLDLKHHRWSSKGYEHFDDGMVQDLVEVEEEQEEDEDEDEDEESQDDGREVADNQDEAEADTADDGESSDPDPDEDVSALPEPIWCEIDPNIRKPPGTAKDEAVCQHPDRSNPAESPPADQFSGT